MLRKSILKNKKGQNIAEYALLLGIVLAAFMAMATFTGRILKAKVKDAGNYIVLQTEGLGTSVQYEEYYAETSYTTNSTDTEVERLGNKLVSRSTNQISNRTGNETESYDAAEWE